MLGGGGLSITQSGVPIRVRSRLGRKKNEIADNRRRYSADAALYLPCWAGKHLQTDSKKKPPDGHQLHHEFCPALVDAKATEPKQLAN